MSSQPKSGDYIRPYHMKIKYLLPFLFVLNCPALLGQSKSAFSFTNNKHSITIPFDLSNNHIYLKVKVNNSDTLSFLFDNGAAASGIMIDSSIAAKIGLKETGKVTATMTGGKNDFSITDSVSLTMSKLFVVKQKVAWFQLKEQEKEEAHQIDGILSYSFFKYFVFEIDYKEGMMTITDPKYYYDKNLKHKIPMIDLDNNRVPMVKGSIVTKNKKVIKTEFIFDTGHDEYFVIGKAFIKKHKLANDTLKVQPRMVNSGLGGQTIHRSARITSFSIGSIKISDPKTIFAFDEDGFYSTLDGVLLGGAFFKNYKLILNYPKKYVVLKN
jgi:hypothetical protein